MHWFLYSCPCSAVAVSPSAAGFRCLRCVIQLLLDYLLYFFWNKANIPQKSRWSAADSVSEEERVVVWGAYTPQLHCDLLLLISGAEDVGISCVFAAFIPFIFFFFHVRVFNASSSWRHCCWRSGRPGSSRRPRVYFFLQQHQREQQRQQQQPSKGSCLV